VPSLKLVLGNNTLIRNYLHPICFSIRFVHLNNEIISTKETQIIVFLTKGQTAVSSLSIKGADIPIF